MELEALDEITHRHDGRIYGWHKAILGVQPYDTIRAKATGVPPMFAPTLSHRRML